MNGSMSNDSRELLLHTGICPLVRAKAKEMHGVYAEIKFSEGWLNALKNAMI